MFFIGKFSSKWSSEPYIYIYKIGAWHSLSSSDFVCVVFFEATFQPLACDHPAMLKSAVAAVFTRVRAQSAAPIFARQTLCEVFVAFLKRFNQGGSSLVF